MVQIIGSGLSNTENTALVTDAQELFVHHPGSLQTYGTAVTTGSESFIYGKSGTSWIAAKVTTDGKLETTATSTSPTAGESLAPVPVSGNYVAGNYNGSLFPLRIINGSELLITGSVSTSVSVSAGSESFNYVASGAGWIQESQYRDIIISGPSAIGSLATQNVTGSVNVNNFDDLGSRRIISAGSVLITNTDVQVSPTTAYASDNVSLDFFRMGLGGWNGIGFDRTRASSGTNIGIGNLRVAVVPAAESGGDIPVIGSQHVTQSTNPWIVLGSVNIDNAANIGSIQDQKVTVTAGSVEAYQASAGELNATVIQDSTLRQISTGSIIVTNTVDVIGSVNVNNFNDLGSSRVITAGSIQTYNQIGSVEVFQTTNADMQVQATQETSPWIVLGSARVVQDSTTRQITAGSVIVTNQIKTQQDRGEFAYSGATLIASGIGTAFITPGAGSKFLLKGFTASAQTASQFRLVFRSGTNVNLISSYNLPASGTVAMNMTGMEPSGAANEYIAVGMFTAGSLHVSVFGEYIL